MTMLNLHDGWMGRRNSNGNTCWNMRKEDATICGEIKKHLDSSSTAVFAVLCSVQINNRE